MASAFQVFETNHLLLDLFNKKAQPRHKVTNLAVFTCEGLTQCYRALVVHMKSGWSQLRVAKFRQRSRKKIRYIRSPRVLRLLWSLK